MPRALLLVLVLAVGACARPRHEVWFTPNQGSPDLIDLFTRPGEWDRARAHVDVLKLYEVQLRARKTSDCPSCGPNILSNLRDAQAFQRLSDWNIELALEAGALKEWSCDGAEALSHVGTAIANAEAAGGTVSAIALDEALLGGAACGLDLAESARRTARIGRSLRTRDRRVGELEPYPRFSAPVLAAWLTALRAEGFTPSFFHLDVDRAHAARIGADVAGDMRALRTFCETQGIPFGVIYWSAETSSNAAYVDDTRTWATTVRATLGVPAHEVFQSWAEGPPGVRTVPLNVPDGDPGQPTHTRLLLDVLGSPR